AQLLEQLGQIPVVAFGLGLAGPVAVARALVTRVLCAHDPGLPGPGRPKRQRRAGRAAGRAAGRCSRRYDLSCSILSLNSVVAIVALRGWPFRKAWANFFAAGTRPSPAAAARPG